jgi:hypothetical protein
MPADAFKLDEIARPEILESGCIEWYEAASIQERIENANHSRFVKP